MHRDQLLLESTLSQVIDAIEDSAVPCLLPLDLRGTPFQLRVWDALREIPPGSTSTYAEIAEKLKAPGSVRAVGGAVAANPLAVVIPCHRVVRSDGQLSGYRWGPERKRALLAREAAAQPFTLSA